MKNIAGLIQRLNKAYERKYKNWRCFFVVINDEEKKYFQYIASDLTQLNSDVIRVFKKVYPIDLNPDLSDIIIGEVDFYAHCITKLGMQLGYWEKVGNRKNVSNTEHVLFRSSVDSGNPQVDVSYNWWVWRINKDPKYVGKLENENRKAEIGAVMPPSSIIHRIKTGIYDGIYPRYE